MLKSLLLTAGLVISLNVLSDNFVSTSYFYHFDLNAKDKVKLELGKQQMLKRKYKEALVTFKEILANSPTDGPTLCYAGQCHFEVGEYKEAMEYLLKGKESPNPKLETYYLLGKIYFSEGKIDEALAEFNSYKSKGTEKEGNEVDINVLISHCNNAKKLMQSPVPVKVINAGNAINSQYDDSSPLVTADGKKMVFSSRRPETTDAPMDVEGDGKFFQDIYISNWDSTNRKWGDAQPVPGQINVDGAHDACTGFSADGKEIFIYRNNLNDPESRGGDVFVSKVNNNKWKTPTPLGKPINTTYWEGGACISPDGKTLFFFSERKGGKGHSDIWSVQKKSRTEWDKPVNLSEINSEYDEGGMFLAPDGKTLFFCSNGMGSMGGQDIFRTIYENGKWSEPVNLGYPINTTRDDKIFTFSADAKKAYLASDRDGGLGGYDIYEVDLSDYAVLEKDFKKVKSSGLSIMKGIVRDGFDGNKIVEGAEIELIDANGNKVSSTTTNENGEYFFSVKGGVTYDVKVSKKGFVEINEKVELPLGENGDTYSLDKQFLLNKK